MIRPALAFVLLLWIPLAGEARPTVGGPIAPDGKTQVHCDVPEGLRITNRGGIDGAGLCVFASITVSANWQNECRAQGLFQAMWNERGGGYPSKVDVMMKRHCPGTPYLQYQGRDLAFLQLALRCRRVVSITWNGREDPRYRGPIAHMVNLVHCDNLWVALLDNNYPDKLLWMTPDELLRGAAGKGS